MSQMSLLGWCVLFFGWFTVVTYFEVRELRTELRELRRNAAQKKDKL